LGFGNFHITRLDLGIPMAVDHLYILASQLFLDDRPVPCFESGFENIELIRINSSLHNVLPQAVSTCDENHVIKAALRIKGEDHATGSKV